MAERKRKLSEVLKRGYSDEEMRHIYELGRFCLENGQQRQAEVIFTGLTSVAPEFEIAWVALACAKLSLRSYEQAERSARRAIEINPDSVEAQLVLASILLMIGDYNGSGTYLGEVGEAIERGSVSNPNLKRFFSGQLVKYQSRAT